MQPFVKDGVRYLPASQHLSIHGKPAFSALLLRP